MDLEALEKAGLTKNQAKIYVSLLKLGEATAQQIMKESGLHRSRIYDGLENLSAQGIVSSIVKDFRKYFQAIKPEKLLDFAEEKKEALQQVIPELKKIEGMKKEEIDASIYKGKEGLKSIHYEMLKEGKDIFVLGAKGYIFSDMPYFVDNFEKQRQKKKMRMFCLWDNEEAKKRAERQTLVKGKLLLKGFESKGVVNIFGDKVAIVLWKEKYPSGFLIDNKDIADSYRKWFDLIWKFSEK
jgi:sugar-specific transcriptional regulator TrmB